MSNYGPPAGRKGLQTTVEKDLKIFDSLPPEVRARLRETVVSVACVSAAQMFKMGYTSEEIIDDIDLFDREVSEEHWYRMNRMAEKGTPYHFLIRRKR